MRRSIIFGPSTASYCLDHLSDIFIEVVDKSVDFCLGIRTYVVASGLFVLIITILAGVIVILFAHFLLFTQIVVRVVRNGELGPRHV